MDVRSGMTAAVVTVGPEHTLRQAAARMTDRDVGSAIVIDPDGGGPGIITERDVLRAVAAGEDPDAATVGEYRSVDATVCGPQASLYEAAAVMMRGGFRHVLVCDGPDLVGILSMRDIVRQWLKQRAPAM